MFLQSIASAFPSQTCSQNDCWELLRRADGFGQLRPASARLLEKVLLGGESGIAKRHLAIEPMESILSKAPEAQNRAFERHAPALAARALTKAVAKASHAMDEIDALFVCTCTGYLCPGVSSHVAETVGMRSDACLHDVVGLGCGAALPTLRQASCYLAAHPEATVAVVAVEICSAAFYIDDDPGVLISLCLFGDGASASVWSHRPSSWQAGRFQSLHLPEHREEIRFVNARGHLRNQLSRAVPELAAEAVENLYAQRGRSSPHVITHTGGREVLRAIRHRLPQAPLTESERVLRDYGNLSSPSVLVALERHLENEEASDSWLAAFGAGFSCHSGEIFRQVSP